MNQHSNKNLQIGITFMVSIFFIFGFITNIHIAMKDQVQLAFALSSLEAQLINFSFFIAYAVFSFLCLIIKKIGYKNGVVASLALIAVGSYMFFPAVLAIHSGASPVEAAKFVQLPFVVIGSVVLLIAVGIAIVNFFLMLLGNEKANVALKGSKIR